MVRSAAFRLFGNLSRFGDGPSKEPFLEQIHANFMSMLLHLNEDQPDVRQACKIALKQIGPLLESAKTNEYVWFDIETHGDNKRIECSRSILLMKAICSMPTS